MVWNTGRLVAVSRSTGPQSRSGGEPQQKEEAMVTIALVLIFVVVFVPLSIAAQRWLFNNAAEKRDPEWELYQQRYD